MVLGLSIIFKRVILKNGKEAVIRKELHKGTFVAYYSGPEGESLFLVTEEQIKQKSAYPYIFWDIDIKKRKKK